MKKIGQREVYRILDANYNRLKEGLRVCEDISRFILNDKVNTRKLKDIRHAVSGSVTDLKYKDLVAARDIGGDIGKADKKSEYNRQAMGDIFTANAQRSKESLRVLEEFSKLTKPSVSKKFKRIRYSFYDVEQKLLKKL